MSDRAIVEGVQKKGYIFYPSALATILFFVKVRKIEVNIAFPRVVYKKSIFFYDR
jgi:hypothetical protein